MHDLLKMTARKRALHIAEVLGAMIDGLWLRYALLGSPGDPEIPRKLTRDCLDAQLA